MLYERAPTCCKFHRKWEVRTQKCCKYPWNSSFQLQNVTNSTNMLQILWKMRGSNSKMLQRQLKWQLQLQNASNRKDNGQKSRSKKKIPKRKQKPKTIPDHYFNWGLYDNSMNWEQTHIYWICLCLVDWRGRWNWPISYWKWPFSSLIYHDFPIQMLVFHRYARNYPLGYQMLGFSKDMYQPFKKPMLRISHFFENNFPLLTKNPPEIVGWFWAYKTQGPIWACLNMWYPSND